MDLTQLSCEDFLSQLASKAPAPGGGGAAALVGAAGVALGNMVGNLTTGKKKYAAVEEEILVLNARAEALRKRLEALVQADADAFTPLAGAAGAGQAEVNQIHLSETGRVNPLPTKIVGNAFMRSVSVYLE